MKIEMCEMCFEDCDIDRNKVVIICEDECIDKIDTMTAYPIVNHTQSITKEVKNYGK